MKRTGGMKQCRQCSREFHVPKWLTLQGGGKYCSKECQNKSQIGQPVWNKGIKLPFKERPYQKGKIPRSAFKIGLVPWNKDKEFTAIRDGNNVNWVGDKVGYDGLHDWVKVRLGTPSKCEFCGTTEKRLYHWANKSRLYKREISDWIRLCVSCHKKYDLGLLKGGVRDEAY